MNLPNSSTGLTPFTSAVAIEAALRELETKTSEESSAAIAALVVSTRCFSSLPALTSYRINEAVEAILCKAENAFRERFICDSMNINSAAEASTASETNKNV